MAESREKSDQERFAEWGKDEVADINSRDGLRVHFKGWLKGAS